MLGIGVAAQASGTLVVTTPAMLIPLFHTELGLGIARVGLLAALPTFGMVLTLVPWGAVTDRYGERWVLAGGLLLTVAATAGATVASGGLDSGPHAARTPSTSALLILGAFLLLTGMAAASTNAASGHVVIGWFPARRRGLAMGIRQTCQLLGVAVAAVTVPPLSTASGAGAAFLLGALLTGACAVACALWIVNPPRKASQRFVQPSRREKPSPAIGAAVAVNPYRANGTLWRIHLASGLLVVPQFTLSIFGLVWLMSEQSWSPLAAGVLLGTSQFVGALGRIGMGMLSDRPVPCSIGRGTGNWRTHRARRLPAGLPGNGARTRAGRATHPTGQRRTRGMTPQAPRTASGPGWWHRVEPGTDRIGGEGDSHIRGR